MGKTFNERDRVTFKNVLPWDVSFSKILMPGEVTVEAYKDYKQLTFAEVEEQINAGNIGFLGTDGYGNHAAFQFDDLDVYNALFQREETKLPDYINEEKVRTILKISNKDKMKKAVEDALQTKSDKKYFMHIIDRMDADDVRQYTGWKISLLEEMFECTFDNYHGVKNVNWRGRFGQ